MPRPLRILIARHGETEWNLSRRFQGHLDSPLTERGNEQAQRLASRLAREPVAAIFSSDLGRAMQTATPIADALGLEVRTSPLLREIDCGTWTGRLKEELAREDPTGIERYRIRPSEHRMPDGESLADVQARGLAFLREVQARELRRPILIITHHIVVETIVVHALKRDLSQLWLSIPTGNCFLASSSLPIADFEH